MTKIEADFLEQMKEFEKLGITSSVNYEKMNEILISHHSTAIEGSSLTLEEARLLLTEGITAKGKPLTDHNMVKDHQDALESVVGMAKKKEPVTPAMIQKISAMVMKTTGSIINAAAGSFDSSKGEWRKLAVSVGSRYFTSYQKVEQEVADFCKIINNRNNQVNTPLNTYNLAFDSHFALVSIHPFADGNGRVSRLLMNYILAYHHLPMAVLYKEDKLEYFAALEKSREAELPNLQPLRDFMYSQQMKYFKEEIRIFTNTTNYSVRSKKKNDTNVGFLEKIM